jgi:hypothetical protein
MTIPRNLGNLAQGANSSGVLQPSYGGTGLTSPGTAGNVLVSNGTAWTSTAAGGTSVGTLQYFSSGAAPISDASWLQCNGTVYTKTTYTALSAAIGSIPNVFSANGGVIFDTSANPQYIRITTNGTNYYAAITYDFCGSTISTAYTSTDANTWATTGVSSAGSIIQDVQYLNSLFVAITFRQSGIGSNTLKTSTDFNTWATRTVTTSTLTILTTARYLNNLYVTAGQGGFLATSTDAITWTSRTSGTTSTINGLAYGGSLYAYCGAGGVLATSTDAITWTARTSNTTSILNNLVYANSKFYAIGGNATSISADGTTWTSYYSNANIGTNNLVYSLGNLFYGINASNNTAVWSANGISWGTLTTSINNGGIATKTNQLLYAQVSSPSYLARAINPFNYSTSTQFAVPNQQATTSTTRIVTDDNSPLYIKAT